MRKLILSLGVLTLIVVLSVKAADAPSQGVASYVTAAEIQAAIAKMPKGGDTNVRVIDGHTANIGVGIVYRPKDLNQNPANGIQHTKVVEVYYVVSGSAVMVTGGTMKDAKSSGQDGTAQGPGLQSATPGMDGAETRTINAGDLVLVPAGVTHYLSKVTSDLTYVAYRIDPTKSSKLMP